MTLSIWPDKIPFFHTDFDTPNQLHLHLLNSNRPLPCVVILPGGGYRMRASDHEGEQIAKFFNAKGMHAIVVDYRVSPNRFPTGLCDAQRAIRIVRANAKFWMVDPDRVVVLGFSAGGHLAGSSLLFEDALPSDWNRDDVDLMSCVPNGGVLCYPVISVEDEYGHVGSGKNLLGAEEWETKKAEYSLQYRVTKETPKAFLWHTSDDPVVNVKNSLVFGERLRDNGVPFEMHIFPSGKHGLGLALAHEDVRQWADLAADWIERNV